MNEVMNVLREPLWEAINRYSLSASSEGRRAAARDVEEIISTALTETCAATAAHVVRQLAESPEPTP